MHQISMTGTIHFCARQDGQPFQHFLIISSELSEVFELFISISGGKKSAPDNTGL
ncbi:unnamed protein product [Protopolystoma xenopodis]|uniref:Uncharacterized protein n=1 Tax=Protopolystoma xenopodis TaxID=117903 RepID=A0A3S5CKF8_9PLAT|nr:unnamed protein product [Protopolystoma xenopodis]